MSKITSLCQISTLQTKFLPYLPRSAPIQIRNSVIRTGKILVKAANRGGSLVNHSRRGTGNPPTRSLTVSEKQKFNSVSVYFKPKSRFDSRSDRVGDSLKQ